MVLEDVEYINELMLKGLKQKLEAEEQLTSGEVTYLTTVLKQNGIKAKGGDADMQTLIKNILKNGE